MIIFATVLSWLVVQFQVSLQALHRDEWQWPWANAVARVITPLAGARVAAMVALLLPVFALAAVLALLGDWLFGAVGLALALAALLYACGRGDYQAACDAQADALIDSALVSSSDSDSDPGLSTTHQAATHLATAHLAAEQRARLNYQAYERWFPVLVWFLVLGAPGAVFYRLLACYAHGDTSLEQSSGIAIDSDSDPIAQSAGPGESDLQNDAQSLLGWFDWLPARLWALGCALAGNFSAAFAVLSERLTNVEPTLDLIDAVVLAAADLSQNETSESEAPRAAALVIERCCELNQRVMVVAFIIILFVVFFF